MNFAYAYINLYHIHTIIFLISNNNLFIILLKHWFFILVFNENIFFFFTVFMCWQFGCTSQFASDKQYRLQAQLADVVSRIEF